VGLSIDGHLLEAGEKATLVTEGGGVVVVWVASFPIRENDSFGAKLADDCGEAEFVLAAGLNVRVGNSEGAAPADAKNLGGFGGFFGARFRSSGWAAMASRSSFMRGLRLRALNDSGSR
jgi:hypothetical protein